MHQVDSDAFKACGCMLTCIRRCSCGLELRHICLPLKGMACVAEAAARHEDELQAYEAEHPRYRDWLAEAATAKAAAAKAARTGKRR